ncbi:DNA-binding transcriptional regulator YhcF, GntR family [Sporanaerobacter acetigenes DSM 13106]|uniref:DNA-binding transcriptional regulator YhcF, GntR family n=2 Tax=Sporanaerobacter acetigenes TaxID=165813 RepID=A0A1M5RXQ3_9FIRM|nr:DNA-binding transcriptional regulator YhcF, GntR family [Sporanaerobacter acetigenes DSM 13106]
MKCKGKKSLTFFYFPIDSRCMLVYYIVSALTYSNVYGGEKMEFDDKLPIYIQIMNYIKKKIVSGEINGGGKLPSVRELSSELKVNPNTVQRTYQELERENLVFTQRGMGTFVIEDAQIIKSLKNDMAVDIVNNFISEMKELGFEYKEIVEIILDNKEKEE